MGGWKRPLSSDLSVHEFAFIRFSVGFDEAAKLVEDSVAEVTSVFSSVWQSELPFAVAEAVFAMADMQE